MVVGPEEEAKWLDWVYKVGDFFGSHSPTPLATQAPTRQGHSKTAIHKVAEQARSDPFALLFLLHLVVDDGPSPVP
jgi:hypothetical protein